MISILGQTLWLIYHCTGGGNINRNRLKSLLPAAIFTDTAHTNMKVPKEKAADALYFRTSPDRTDTGWVCIKHDRKGHLTPETWHLPQADGYRVMEKPSSVLTFMMHNCHLPENAFNAIASAIAVEESGRMLAEDILAKGLGYDNVSSISPGTIIYDGKDFIPGEYTSRTQNIEEMYKNKGETDKVKRMEKTVSDSFCAYLLWKITVTTGTEINPLWTEDNIIPEIRRIQGPEVEEESRRLYMEDDHLYGTDRNDIYPDGVDDTVIEEMIRTASQIYRNPESAQRDGDNTGIPENGICQTDHRLAKAVEIRRLTSRDISIGEALRIGYAVKVIKGEENKISKEEAEDTIAIFKNRYGLAFDNIITGIPEIDNVNPMVHDRKRAAVLWQDFTDSVRNITDTINAAQIELRNIAEHGKKIN